MLEQNGYICAGFLMGTEKGHNSCITVERKRRLTLGYALT